MDPTCIHILTLHGSNRTKPGRRRPSWEVSEAPACSVQAQDECTGGDLGDSGMSEFDPVEAGVRVLARFRNRDQMQASIKRFVVLGTSFFLQPLHLHLASSVSA